MRWSPSLLLTLLVLACDDDAAGPYGEPCASDDACEALYCVADRQAKAADLEPLALVCGDREGDEDDVGRACESGEDCARGVCLLAGGCARPCERAADCADAERCAPVFARAGEDALASLDACVAIGDLGAGVEVDSVIARDAARDGTSEIELEAFERGAQTIAVLEHLDPDWPGVECRPPLCLRALRTREAEPVALFDADADYRSAPPPAVPVAGGDHISPLVIQLPGGSAPELSAQGYVAELVSERGGDVRVTRISGDGGHQLDLNVFYVGKLGVEPEGERGPAPLADALDRVEQILGQADIVLGDVRQIAVPGKLPMRGTYFADGADPGAGFAMLQVRFGAYVELPGLFQLSAGAGNRAVNLFLLAEIEPLVSGQETEAQAGGIPGPPAMHGTSGSGIAISADMMLATPGGFGRTLAHEIAHYLGLFHTSEVDGSVLENLADTAECRPEQDAGGDGLSRDDCAEHGADNLMFWAKAAGTELSEQQRAQLRLSPLLH